PASTGGTVGVHLAWYRHVRDPPGRRGGLGLPQPGGALGAANRCGDDAARRGGRAGSAPTGTRPAARAGAPAGPAATAGGSAAAATGSAHRPRPPGGDRRPAS